MELKQVHHSHLQKLVWELPRIVLCDRASSTTSKYLGSFKRWSHWASSYGIQSIPADAKFLALYLADVLKSPSPVLAALYGVSWAHQKALLEDPSKHPLVTQVVDAAKHLLAHPVQKKRPLTIAHVRKIVHKFAQPGAALSTLQMFVLIVLGFAGFLRWSDLAQIWVEQLFSYRSHMSIYLEKRKNDQFCDGQYVHISNSGLSTCPVKLTKIFLHWSEVSKGPLFRAISGQGANQKITRYGLSYSQVCLQFHCMMLAIGLRSQDYCTHSLRSRGAVELLERESDRLISAHGGW